MRNLPYDFFVRNEAWMTLTMLAQSLLAWTQMLGVEGALAQAEPKTIRYRILHIGGQMARRGRSLILRIDTTWPWSNELVTGFTHLRDAFP
ncbi:MAG: transposase [Acidimicrobiales bacterium]